MALLFTMFFFSCSRSPDALTLIPPPTNPMEREYIGYGVVDASFVYILEDPLQDNSSLGYLRRRSLVKIMERQPVSIKGTVESWVKVEAPYAGTPDGEIEGWLKESSLTVYDNEDQAETAAKAMTP